MAERIEDTDAIRERASSLVESHRRLLTDLIEMRERHQVTQQVVAERMGVSQSAVSQFERYDANPQLSTIRRYALAIGARIEHRVLDDYTPVARSKSSPEVTVERHQTKAPNVAWGSSRMVPVGA